MTVTNRYRRTPRRIATEVRRKSAEGSQARALAVIDGHHETVACEGDSPPRFAARPDHIAIDGEDPASVRLVE